MIILLNLSEKLKGTIPLGHRDDALLAASESIDFYRYEQCSISITVEIETNRFQLAMLLRYSRADSGRP